MKKRIKTSKKDNRHTTKPYNNELWNKYAKDYFRFNNEELARKYLVSKKTIYKWNTELRKKYKEAALIYINNSKSLEEVINARRKN